MILLYTSPGCASCRKAKQWLKDREMDFEERNLFSTILKEEEIKTLLSRTENGTDDIISTRSKAFQALDCDIEDLTMKELIALIQKNPSILRRPIMISETNFVVGYDDDEITALVPAHLRNMPNINELRNIADKACNPSCANYSICGSVRVDCE